MSYGLTVTDAHSYGLTVTDAHSYGLTVTVTGWEYHEYPPALLFYDRMTDTDGTLLENHTPQVGTGWTASRSGIEISDNKAHFQTGATAPLIVDTNVTAASVTMAALLYPTNTGGEAGFCIRRTGAALTWHYITLTSSGGVTGTLAIVRRTPLATLATSGAVSIIQGSPYILEVTCAGDDITATIRGYYNEATTITATDATNSGTHTCGLFMGAHGVQIDEFQVTA